MEATGSWLCPTELDRARVVDANARVRKAREVAAGAVFATTLLAVPWLGWWILLPLPLALANLLTLDRRMAASARPERHAAFSIFSMLLLIAAIVATTGGMHSPLLPWLVIPGSLTATRFRGKVVAVGALITTVAVLLTTIPLDPAGFVENPVPILATLTLLASVTAVTIALMGAELQHRDDAVLDPLTKLLNRHALEARVAEIELQSRISGGSVCLIAADLDHFKRVNDSYGHERGDDALRETAYEMRKTLRSFELFYRVGGEEFLVLLPGIELAQGREIAERLRASVEEARPAALELTLSLGVSAGSLNEVRFQSLYRAADAALLQAKREGRNRVVATGELLAIPVPAVPEAPPSTAEAQLT